MTRELAIGAAESFGDVATDRIDGVIQLRAQLQVLPDAGSVGDLKDLHPELMAELPDDQFFEMTRTSHSIAESRHCARALSTSYAESTQESPAPEHTQSAISATQLTQTSVG